MLAFFKIINLTVLSRTELCEAIYFVYRVSSQLGYSEDVVCMPTVLKTDLVRSLWALYLVATRIAFNATVTL